MSLPRDLICAPCTDDNPCPACRADRDRVTAFLDVATAMQSWRERALAAEAQLASAVESGREEERIWRQTIVDQIEDRCIDAIAAWLKQEGFPELGERIAEHAHVILHPDSDEASGIIANNRHTRPTPKAFKAVREDK